MSTVNIIKQYFHARNVPVSEERTRRLIALAYQTAKVKGALPKGSLCAVRLFLPRTV